MNEEERSIARVQSALRADFQIERLLGRGSSSAVYQARELALDRVVAIKILHPALSEDLDALRRFEEEAKAVAALDHPHVARAYRFGRLSDGTPYLVMRLVKGPTIRERLEQEGALLPELAIPVLKGVVSALAAAHAIGIVHRDVRPENVLWDERSDEALLVDFGISALFSSRDAKLIALNETDSLFGDPSYMSPEQVRNEDLSVQADIYSFGVLGYELLTGQGPYDASTDEELLEAHLHGEPKDLMQGRDDLETNIVNVLRRCLEKDPELRPAASDIRRALDGVWKLPRLDDKRWRFPWHRR
ncbi:MAG: serine/threonine protein kinase [Gemmatimonadetes bacterium]|nr:serine/threonine protein kinase [Gemmatimonadota bacterium]